MDLEKNRTGSKWKESVIQVPVGTMILSEDKKSVIKDFTKEQDSFVIKEVELVVEAMQDLNHQQTRHQKNLILEKRKRILGLVKIENYC